MRMKIFYSHYTYYTDFFSFFITFFFRDRQRSNAISNSNIASSAFWKIERKNFWPLFAFSAENKMH